MNPLQVGGTLFESPMSFKKSPSGAELENISFGFIEKKFNFVWNMCMSEMIISC